MAGWPTGVDLEMSEGIFPPIVMSDRGGTTSADCNDRNVITYLKSTEQLPMKIP